MFAIDCPHHGARTLASTDDIRRYQNTEHGIVMEVECHCGGVVTVVTGRAAAKPAAATVAAAQPTADRELVGCGAAA